MPLLKLLLTLYKKYVNTLNQPKRVQRIQRLHAYKAISNGRANAVAHLNAMSTINSWLHETS